MQCNVFVLTAKSRQRSALKLLFRLVNRLGLNKVGELRKRFTQRGK